MSEDTATKPPETPECDRLNAEAPRHRIVGEFIEWLNENGFTICEMIEGKGWGSTPYLPTRLSTEQMLAKFLEIDLDKVEVERRAFLDWCRQQSAFQ